jgi:membrane associated rhomboid family serine protease
VFCAMVLRPALTHVDDRALVAVMGNVHRYGDRRMPVPGVVGLVAAAISVALGAASGHWAEAGAAGVAAGLLLAWLVLYLRVSAPINRQLVAAADSAEPVLDARALQRNWDKVITARATLQGFAVAALCLALVI